MATWFQGTTRGATCRPRRTGFYAVREEAARAAFAADPSAPDCSTAQWSSYGEPPPAGAVAAANIWFHRRCELDAIAAPAPIAEATPAGAQFVLPGAERRQAPSAKQLDLLF